MSDEVLILYGSRARGDARPGADVDLLLATSAVRPQPPVERSGVSVHRYPRSWLLSQASAGELFAYHVAFEGVPLLDGDGFLLNLRSAFRTRDDYLPDARNGLLVARLLAENDWGADAGLRRRFFWGIRTCVISMAAEMGRPVFASRVLEATSGIDGLADILERRETVCVEECRSLLLRVEEGVAELHIPRLHGEALRAFLKNLDGYYAECVLASERRRWEDKADVVPYA